MELMRVPLCCAVSIYHPLAQKKQLSVTDLYGEKLMMAIPQWSGVHPLLKILPVDWDYTIPFGLLHSPTPSDTVARFLQTMEKVFPQT